MTRSTMAGPPTGASPQRRWRTGALAHWRGHPVTVADVHAISPDEARAIYHGNYWNTVRGGELAGGVDLVVFDISVNSGPRRAVATYQLCIFVAIECAAVDVCSPQAGAIWCVNSILTLRYSKDTSFRAYEFSGKNRGAR